MSFSKDRNIESPHYGISPFDPEAKHPPINTEANRKANVPDEQMNFGLDKMIEALVNPASIVSVKEQIPMGRREAGRKMDTLTLNEGTNDEIRMEGRFYTISSKRKNPLQIRTSPPETRGSEILDSIKGYRVFVLKDSENSDDPSARGWASVIVLEITPKGEKPKLKRFSNGLQSFVLCRARMNDIKRKQ